MTDAETGRVSYEEGYRASAWRPRDLLDRFRTERSEAMTAAGILCRILLGEDPRTSEPIRRGSRLCAALLPSWNPDSGSIDLCYWYWGTLAMHQVGGQGWYSWERGLNDALLRHQHGDGSGARTGSWDPIDPWGAEMGRVGSTALVTLSLGAPNRYERAFGPK